MHSTNNRHQHGCPEENGFSLVELLIAMTLGLILVAGMMTVFSGNKRSSDINSAMSDMQENARFALDNLARDIRMSGFQGCLDTNDGGSGDQNADSGGTIVVGVGVPTNNLIQTSAMASVVGTGSIWLPSAPSGFVTANHNALPGTHALTLQFGSPATYPLDQDVNTGGTPNTTAPIIVDTTPGNSRDAFDLVVGDFAMISNCQGADIIKISSLSTGANTATIGHAAPENTSGALSQLYLDDDNVTKFMRFISNVYYVGDTGLTNENGDRITALYQHSLPYGDVISNPPTELVRGVEDLRVTFGIRNSNGSLNYVLPTDSLYNPSAVENIRIGLLMNSYDRIADDDDSSTYVLAGQQIVPEGSTGAPDAAGTHSGDRRFRLAFNTTVKIRNRRNEF